MRTAALYQHTGENILWYFARPYVLISYFAVLDFVLHLLVVDKLTNTEKLGFFVIDPTYFLIVEALGL